MSIFELLESAIDKRDDSGYSFTLTGDLHQMAAQKRMLVYYGYDVGQKDVYPALRTEETFKEALRLFLESRIDGWWNYEKELVGFGICEQEEYNNALGRDSGKRTVK